MLESCSSCNDKVNDRPSSDNSGTAFPVATVIHSLFVSSTKALASELTVVLGSHGLPGRDVPSSMSSSTCRAIYFKIKLLIVDIWRDRLEGVAMSAVSQQLLAIPSWCADLQNLRLTPKQIDQFIKSKSNFQLSYYMARIGGFSCRKVFSALLYL